MAECDVCETPLSMPRTCSYCDGAYCTDHHLPEHHNCDMAGVANAAGRDNSDDGPDPMDPKTVGTTPKDDPPSPPDVTVSTDRSLTEKLRALVGRLF